MASLFPIVQKVYAACEAGGETSIDLGECLTLSNNTTIKSVYSEPAFLVNLSERNLVVVGGVMLFLYVFYAGFLFVSQGKKGMEQAQKMATTAVIGFVLLFSAYWIVQIVQLLTGVNMGL